MKRVPKRRGHGQSSAGLYPGSQFWSVWLKSLFTLVILIAPFSFSAHAHDGRLIVGYGEDSYPAYFFEDNRWQGMDVDIINRLVERADLEASIIAMKFPRIYLAVETGRVQIAANLTRNEARSEFLDWIGPVRTSAIALITSAQFQDIEITDYDGLVHAIQSNRMKLAYLNGTSFSLSLDAKLAEPAFREHLFFISENAAAVRMLHAGRILGFLYDDFEARAILASPLVAKRTGFDGLVIHDFRVPGSEAGAYIGLSKKVPAETRALLKAAFAAMQETGELSAIACKWGAQDAKLCGAYSDSRPEAQGH